MILWNPSSKVISLGSSECLVAIADIWQLMRFEIHRSHPETPPAVQVCLLSITHPSYIGKSRKIMNHQKNTYFGVLRLQCIEQCLCKLLRGLVYQPKPKSGSITERPKAVSQWHGKDGREATVIAWKVSKG